MATSIRQDLHLEVQNKIRACSGSIFQRCAFNNCFHLRQLSRIRFPGAVGIGYTSTLVPETHEKGKESNLVVELAVEFSADSPACHAMFANMRASSPKLAVILLAWIHKQWIWASNRKHSPLGCNCCSENTATVGTPTGGYLQHACTTAESRSRHDLQHL